MLTYRSYGIEREAVERIKKKLKDPALKEQVKGIMEEVTASDLQDRTRVGDLTAQVASILGETLSQRETDSIVRFVVDQKIDPGNTFHLIKLWSKFR